MAQENQSEVKIVFFRGGPKDRNVIADVYIDGVREFCGTGFRQDLRGEELSWNEARQFIADRMKVSDFLTKQVDESKS